MPNSDSPLEIRSCSQYSILNAKALTCRKILNTVSLKESQDIMANQLHIKNQQVLGLGFWIY